jgi:hypothetical protein
LRNDIARWSRSYTSTLVDRRSGRGWPAVISHFLKPLRSQTPRGAFRSLEAR